MTRSQGMPARSLARLTADGEGASNMHSTSSSSGTERTEVLGAVAKRVAELFAVGASRNAL